ILWRLWRRESELVKLKCRQFAGYQIGCPLDVGEAQPGRYRESICVVQARIVKTAGPLHFQISDKGVPIGNRTPARVGMEIDASQAKGRGNQSGRRLAVRSKRLPIQQQGGIELARSPAKQDRPHGGFIHLERVAEGRKVRRQVDDGTHIQIAVGPAIQSTTYSRSK